MFRVIDKDSSQNLTAISIRYSMFVPVELPVVAKRVLIEQDNQAA
jgi:hypothetical protein